jgi:hypothetical protein
MSLANPSEARAARRTRYLGDDSVLAQFAPFRAASHTTCARWARTSCARPCDEWLDGVSNLFCMNLPQLHHRGGVATAAARTRRAIARAAQPSSALPASQGSRSDGPELVHRARRERRVNGVARTRIGHRRMAHHRRVE